jgi:cytochrome c2
MGRSVDSLERRWCHCPRRSPHSISYLTDPQAVIPGAVMLYKQKNADVRKAIIAFLKEQK